MDETYFERLKKIKLGLAPKEAVKKSPKPINKISKKKKQELKLLKDENGDTELQKWFRARIKMMRGVCMECGSPTNTKVYNLAISSICHILPKRDTMCPSVKLHPLNWIELCWDCHTFFDNARWEERELMDCWEIIKERLIMVLPDLAKEELRHFPKSVKDYIDENDQFKPEAGIS